jgi:lipoteichoic acid synthase
LNLCGIILIEAERGAPMLNSLNKDIGFLNKFIGFYFLSVIILWLKTYVTQLTVFNLGVEGTFQHFLLFINPLGSALLFLGLSFFAKGRRKYIWLMIIYTFMSIWLYANVMYYRFFNDFITLPTIFQTQNFGDLGGSVASLFQVTDVLFFVDWIVLIALLVFKVIKVDKTVQPRKKAIAILTLSLGMMCLNLGLAESDRPELLTRGFDRNYIVKYLGMYNFTIYDAVESTKAASQRVLADSSDVTEIINYTQSNYAAPNEEYFGIAEGRNVVYLHLESIQTFLMDYHLNGEEVMPFLNSLAKDEDTIYFDNFFHQTAQGKTADSEFIIENSLFGLPQGAAFITKGRNTYHAAPAILKDHGYTSAVLHGNGGSFWNRNEIYKSFGFDHFFDLTYYDVESDEDLAEYGLMDKPFYKQSVDHLKSLQQPFYTKLIPVTHHYPFELDEELATIGKADTGDRTVDNYFQTARYADEALEQLFNDLKEAGLYDNTIFILYGDHYGISQNHNRAMSEIIGKEVGSFESAGLQRVPLLIHIPGADMEGGVNHTYGGQIDLLPTLLHLLGVDSKPFVHFGQDLLSKDHNQVTVFRNGDYVSPEIFAVEGKYFDTETGLPIEDEEKLKIAKELKDEVEYKLMLSDKTVNGDLLRFYTPEGFTPVDRNQYDYSKSE